MKQDIKYNGYSASPSDYICPDGDLAYALNVIPERGSLRSLCAPGVVATNLPGNVLAMHRVANREHYIIHKDRDLMWAPTSDINVLTTLATFTAGVRSVTPLGNTLIVLTQSGAMYYFLWQGSAYKALGSKLPNLEARPYISTVVYDRTKMDTDFGIEFTQTMPSALLSGEGLLNTGVTKSLYNGQTSSVALYGDARQKIYEKVFACINQFNRIFQRKGYFTSPFYVRFAYRLYDGSHVMHTVPILLVPTTLGKPYPGVQVKQDGTLLFDPLFSASRLVADIDLPDDFANWSDLITHVDVFVTQQARDYTDSPEALVSISQAPFYEYTENQWTRKKEQEPRLMTLKDDAKLWQPLIGEYVETASSSFKLASITTVKDDNKYQFIVDESSAATFLVLDVTPGDGKLTYATGGQSGVEYPPLNTEEVPIDLIDALPKGTYKIYLLHGKYTFTFSGPKQSTIRRYISVASGGKYDELVHHSIELRRTDGKSYAEELTGYNAFYHVAEIDLSLFANGFGGEVPLNENVLVDITTRPVLSDLAQGRTLNTVSQAFSYNNRLNIIVEAETLPECTDLGVQNPAGELRPEIKPVTVAAYVKVVENSQTSYKEIDVYFDAARRITYFAYPRATATELIKLNYADAFSYDLESIPLIRHPYLNLSYAFNMFNEVTGTITRVAAKDAKYPQDPIIYGNKIKTSPVNNPFVFIEENTSELPVGKIYALSTAAKALSQGQFGQFPLYAFTDEGVWALKVTGSGTYAGSQVLKRDICTNYNSITQIDDAVLFSSDRGIMLLSGSDTICISEILAGTVFDTNQLRYFDTTLKMQAWETYHKNIRLLYCYPTQKIIAYNPEYHYFYVYSLESKQWAIQQGQIRATVNNFPQAYAINGDNQLVDYAVEGAPLSGAIVTRPFKLGSPDTHKTITGIIQRGHFVKGNVTTLLYGSRDLNTWYPIYGSYDHCLFGMRGTPYKYFRIASLLNLGAGESLYGASIQYENKLESKLR